MTNRSVNLLRRAMRGFGEMFHALAPSDVHRYCGERAVGACKLGADADPFFDSIVVFDNEDIASIAASDVQYVWTDGV